MSCFPKGARSMAPTAAIRDQKWLSPGEAALYLRLSASTLAKWRLTGLGPAYRKVGHRSVLYSIEEINAWLEQRRFRSTSEVPARQQPVDPGHTVLSANPVVTP